MLLLKATDIFIYNAKLAFYEYSAISEQTFYIFHLRLPPFAR